MRIQAWEPKWSMSLSFICSGRCVWLDLKFTRIQQMFICYIGGGDRGTFTLRFPSSLFDSRFKRVILGNPLDTWIRWQVSSLLSVFGTLCRFWHYCSNKVALMHWLDWRISPIIGNYLTFSSTYNSIFALRTELYRYKEKLFLLTFSTISIISLITLRFAFFFSPQCKCQSDINQMIQCHTGASLFFFVVNQDGPHFSNKFCK